jgi:hypothetical protein
VTTPNQRPTAPESVVPPVILRHDDEALSLEDQAARMTAGGLRNKLDDITQAFSLRWVRTFGTLRTKASGPQFTSLMADLAAELGQLSINPHSALIDYAQKATDLGVQQGFAESGLDPQPLDVPVPMDIHTYASGITHTAQAQVSTAESFAKTLTGGTFNQTVLASVAPAQQAANIVDRAARTITNERLNAGVSAVADELGAELLWVAERDACVVCLALSGHHPGPDGLFDETLTFGTKPMEWVPEGGLDGPPRHPRCRCRVTTWFGHDTEGAESITHDWAAAVADAQGARHQAIMLDDRESIANANRAIDAAHKAADAARRSAAFDLPAALRREAERSVLKGWALDSEPDSVRSRAAERLLNRIVTSDGYSPSGWKVPKSVRKQTETRLKKGTLGATPVP